MQIDRTAARALVDAGYMPLNKYIEMFADEPVADAKPAASFDPSSRSVVHGHFATPLGRSKYRITYKRDKSAA